MFVILQNMTRFFLSLLLLLSSCGTSSKEISTQNLFFEGAKKTLVSVPIVENHSGCKLSTKASIAFSEAIWNRLEKKQNLVLSKQNSKDDPFLVKVQLLQYDEINRNPPELAISVNIQVLSTQGGYPQIIYQEILCHNTLLEKPLNPAEELSWKDEKFRLSPLGLSFAKLSRDISSHIEDSILLFKGN